jgi:hypothetical protein
MLSEESQKRDELRGVIGNESEIVREALIEFFKARGRVIGG